MFRQLYYAVGITSFTSIPACALTLSLIQRKEEINKDITKNKSFTSDYLYPNLVLTTSVGLPIVISWPIIIPMIFADIYRNDDSNSLTQKYYYPVCKQINVFLVKHTGVGNRLN